MDWIALAIALSAPPVMVQTSAEPPITRDHRQRAEQFLFEAAGFASPIEAGLADRDVRRLAASDPYMMLPVPGVEIELHRDGRVTVRLQYPGWSSAPTEIGASTWRDLVARDQAAFAKPPAVNVPQPEPSEPRQPPPICHGWTVHVQADEDRLASWGECGRQPGPTADYAATMMKMAISTRGSCTFDAGEPFWSFSRCFTPGPRLDDPLLEASVASLRAEYDSTHAMNRLTQARYALAAPGISLGNAQWLNARAAVANVKMVNDYRRERLHQLTALASNATTASPSDRYRLRQTISAWSDFIQGQDRIHSGLLARLVAEEDQSPAAPE